MTSGEVNRIVSEDYADLLFEYVDYASLAQRFTDYTINQINFLNTIVHVPVEYITNHTIMEFGYTVMPSCLGLVNRESLEASGVFQVRRIPNFNLRGQGVLIGIIDSGIDYTNPIFRNADGTTRIAAIWDQTIQGNNPPINLQYGTLYTKEQINAALQSGNPLELVPTADDIGHGTMVAAIAGGNEDPTHNFYGVAPDAEFVVVKLKPAKSYLKQFFFIPEDAVCYQENDVASGIEFLLDIFVELRRPMSICLAVDTSQGSHDGRGSLSSYISLIATIEGISVSVAAGNEGNARRHYYAIVDKTVGYDTVELEVAANETGFSMELWGQRPSIYSVEIHSPSGEVIPRIAVGRDEFREVSFIFETTIINLDFQMIESQSGNQLILFRFDKPAQGIWKIIVYERVGLNLGFHIWLPMEGFISNNTFFIRSDPYTTVLALGNTIIPITATAYNHVNDSIYIAASRGYSRIGNITPEIAAPGVNITGPTLEHTFQEYSGTSVAVAHLSGINALLLEWGIVKGNLPTMSTIQLKKLIIRGARRDVNLEYPNRDWGYGILDIFNVYDSLRAGINV